MNILVTGGNGQLGGYIVSNLLLDGHKVAVFDTRFDTEYLSRIEKSAVYYIQGDVGNMSNIMEAVKTFKPEIIYHLAGMLSLTSTKNPQLSIQINGIGTFNVLEAARLFEVRQVMYASSLLTYGKSIFSQIVDDNTIQRPTEIYGINKLYSELLGRYYREKYGIDFRSGRFATIIGPEAKVRHITVYNTWMIEKSYYGKPYEAFVSPELTTPLIYYKDAIKALLQLSEAPVEKINTVCYNLSSYRLSAQEMANHVKAIIPSAKITFNPDEEVVLLQRQREKWIYDCSKAKEEWGWEPTFTIEEMIKDFCQELAKKKVNR